MFSYTLELYPNYGSIHISLFTNVKNSAELRKRLLSHDSELSYAFVDAKVVKILSISLFCSDILEFSEDQLRSKLGQEQGSWVYNACRGIDYSDVITRTKIKSMLRFWPHHAYNE